MIVARSAFSKVMLVGRATVFAVGLAVVLASLFGVATTALGATGANLILGRFNAAETPTALVSTLTDATKAALNVQNKSGGPALNLGVAEGKAPLTVNAAAGTATNLSADKLDGKDSGAFLAADGKAQNAAHADQADSATSAQNAQNATNAQNANTLDSKDSADFMAATLPAVRVGLQYQHFVESNSQYTPIGFANEDFDQGGEMHTAANNSRLVAPRAGIYQVDVQLSWMANGANEGLRSAGVVMNQNGACNMYGSLAFDRLVSASGSAAQYNHMSTLVAMNQGDYIEVCANQNSSNQQWINNAYTFASMHYVSGR